MRLLSQLFPGLVMSLQICHCGWSKVTSYHGLRTHQGKMGCTEKGLRIPKEPHLLFNTNLPRLTSIYPGPPIEIEEPLWVAYPPPRAGEHFTLLLCALIHQLVSFICHNLDN